MENITTKKPILTLDEFEKELIPVFTPEDYNVLADKYRETVSKEDAAEMMLHFSEQIAEQVKSNPETAKIVSEWDAGDKVLFLIREAYTLGAVHATDTIAAAIAHAAAELLKNFEIAYPIEKKR